MFERVCFLHFFFCLLLTAPAVSSIARPGCPTKCGNLDIPYPFGFGGYNCSMNPFYSIICNHSTNPPKPYIVLGHTWEVTGINASQIRIKLGVEGVLSKVCNNSEEGSSLFQILFSDQYALSGNNRVTGIGCNNYITINSNDGESDFYDGCVSTCFNSIDSPRGNGLCSDTDFGSSPSYGCCRIPIPRGTTYVIVVASELSESSGILQRVGPYQCGYAFIGDRHALTGNSSAAGFSYPLSYLNKDYTALLNDYRPDMESLALELDWWIGNNQTNCSHAQMNSPTYACQGENSNCTDYETSVGVRGYTCQCKPGYEGNPYLSRPGCLDINECDQLNRPCHEDSHCINLPGNFTCECRKGFYGDGRIHGTGCHPLPHSKTFINVAIGLSSGMGLLVLLSICFRSRKLYQKRKDKKRKEKFFKRNGGLLLQQQTDEGTQWKMNPFPIKELEKATDRFNESRILGQGGQGTVYKGMLSDGKIVAIKKSKLVDENQLEQFINEVVILSQINHKNVVKLLGCCLETEVPLLVYEFVANGTLLDFIHDASIEFPISWNMRLKIAADVAGALAYLHSAASIPIYHRDIKSSNILLDEKYIAKVSDFGTSKSIVGDQTHFTTLVKGTFGYLDPEYFQSSQFTEKSDVYSYGVVLAELLTGQRPISSKEDERGLAARFLQSMETDSLETILDAQVSQDERKEQVFAVARLTRRCLNLIGRNRPTMKEVATELESIRTLKTLLAPQGDFQEAQPDEFKPMTVSDSDYTWSTSGHGVTSDAHPLMFNTV